MYRNAILRGDELTPVSAPAQVAFIDRGTWPGLHR